MKKALLTLVAIWIVAGGIIWWARASKPSPESLARYVEAHPLASSDHDKTLRYVAEQLNELDYDQRREMRVGKKLDRFFKQLTPDEQSRFLDLTLPSGFKQMMDAFNKMEPEKRKKFVEKALAEMKAHEGEDRPPGADDANAQKIVQQGLRSFYSEASADVKLDLSPLLEQMQRNLQAR